MHFRQVRRYRRQPDEQFKNVTELARAVDPTEGRAIMPSAKIILCILSILGVCAGAQRISSQAPVQAPARDKRIVLAASTGLDGKGRVLHDTRIVVEGSRMAASDPKAEPVDYDLHGLTVLP